MLLQAWNRLFGATPAKFESRHSLDASVRRLAEGTSVWSLSLRERAVGRVTASKVRLRRRYGFLGSNSYQAQFYGRFEVAGGKVLLSGRFSLPLSTRVFTALWLAVALLISAVTSFYAVRSDEPLLIALLPWALPVFGALMFAFFTYLARNDVAWLSAHIRKRLAD